jgi:hypothetical protein
MGVRAPLTMTERDVGLELIAFSSELWVCGRHRGSLENGWLE